MPNGRALSRLYQIVISFVAYNHPAESILYGLTDCSVKTVSDTHLLNGLYQEVIDSFAHGPALGCGEPHRYVKGYAKSES
jgi:hypothetical protein